MELCQLWHSLRIVRVLLSQVERTRKLRFGLSVAPSSQNGPSLRICNHHKVNIVYAAILHNVRYSTMSEIAQRPIYDYRSISISMGHLETSPSSVSRTAELHLPCPTHRKEACLVQFEIKVFVFPGELIGTTPAWCVCLFVKRLLFH